MNTKFVLASCVAALSGLAGLATPAKAGTDLRVNLNLPLPRSPAIIISEHDRDYDRRGDWDRRNDSYRDHGYWKEITVRTWVPGHHVLTRDRRGCEVRVFEPGRYVYRTERVWVAGRDDHRRYDRG